MAESIDDIENVPQAINLATDMVIGEFGDRHIKLAMSDGLGNPLDSYYSAETDKWVLSIHDADVHTRVVNKYMHQHTDIATTLTAAVIGNGSEYEIEVEDAQDFLVGDPLHINTSTVETTHPTLMLINGGILPVTGPATFTLDRRLDMAHDIGDVVRVSVTNIASQDGTMAAPQEYWVQPEIGEVWHITRILFEMTHAAGGDLGKFGGVPALANGVLLRAFVGGKYGTLTNWKTNGDMKTDMFDVVFDDRSGGQGNFGTSGRGTFKETGAVLRLNGDSGDRIELYVQDPMPADLLTFRMKTQGHFEG